MGFCIEQMEQDMLDEGLKKVQGLRFKVQGKKGTVEEGKRDEGKVRKGTGNSNEGITEQSKQ